ncbi:hypothetical protein MN0502_29890 [Arthrobacter sp. MN05-02]|nr:hypothetical protein MN0502_29890 [Arthrobacter sp. MN05-02]
MEDAAAALGSGSKGADDAYAAALDHWMASGAVDLEDRMPAVLADVADGIDPATPTTALSGGQLARVALAALLLSRFDVVLLDEPTNDLDLAGLERLESFIQNLRGGVVLVSHDREFLARCVTTVVELDLAQNRVAVYDGGYDSFLEERAVARRHAREAYEEYAEKKQDLVGRARTQREWSSQGVRNAMKKSPDNDKIRRKASMESSEKQAQKVRQMESRIARLDEVEEPRKEWQLQFTIGAAPRSSSVVATLNNASATQGGFTLGPVSLQVNAGERIGITGPNGARGSPRSCGSCWGTSSPTAGWPPSDRAWPSVRSTRRADSWTRPFPSALPSRRWCRSCPRPRCGPSSRNSGSRPIRCVPSSGPSPPVSAPGPGWPCCRHAA